MASPSLILLLLMAVCFSCATWLNDWRQSWEGSRNKASALAFIMGDSRRMFADHFFVKADVYFHSGYYPTIFDSRKQPERSHMEETSSHVHDETCDHAKEEAAEHEHDEHCEHGEESEAEDEGDFLGKPKDIIDKFGRNFYATSHSHLKKKDEREMLPWLKLSASLDPQKVQTYTVAAFWLRTKLGKVEESQDFLREGLRNNPDSYEILFELGKLRNENFNDPAGARNLWEMAIRKFKKQAAEGRKPDDFLHSQILANLAALEEKTGNYDAAMVYFELLKPLSPYPETIDQRLQELREKKAAAH